MFTVHITVVTKFFLTAHTHQVLESLQELLEVDENALGFYMRVRGEVAASTRGLGAVALLYAEHITKTDAKTQTKKILQIILCGINCIKRNNKRHEKKIRIEISICYLGKQVSR